MILVKDESHLLDVTIPLYIKEFVASKSIREKYYEKGKKDIPIKYCDKVLYNTQGVKEPNGTTHGWKAFPVIRQGKKKMIDYLTELASGRRIIANESKVGKEKHININGQAIYNGNVARFVRNKMMNQIKAQYTTYLEPIPAFKPEDFPLRIFVYVFDTLIDEEFTNGQHWDLDNRFFPYGKALSDALTNLGKIPDDNIYYITESPHPIFVPVEDTEDRKFVIRFYRDDRPVITNNFLIKRFFNRV